MTTNYEKFKAHLSKIADIRYASALMHWDQETYMPENGAPFRAQQLSTLAGFVHELATSDELGNLLQELKNDTSLSDREKRNIKLTLKDFEKSQKYTKEFVQDMSRSVSEAYQAWHEAKSKSDFSIFAPKLKKLVALKRQECEMLGYADHPYDAMLDQYEPGLKTKEVTTLFSDVRAQLVDFVKNISEQEQNDESFMYLNYNKDKQWDFGIHLLEQMGYDFKSGRQDLSTHPFTINFSSDDVRVTTRVAEDNVHEMIWSCIHEGGHALYEQGLRSEDYGLPTGEAISLGVHESQSRLWENNVGRGLGYWKANYPKLQEMFPENLSTVSVEDFYKAMNIVKPSLIRTNADELTYHFHILIRFEVEKALMEGTLEVDDLPAYWNAKYKEYLNIDVPSDTQGVLQDIHWSHGSFGYFPTYSIGSFYAAQFYRQAVKEIDGLEMEIEQGNMQPLLDWLRAKVHDHGKLYSAEELCIKITGEPLNFKYFMDYATVKYSHLYNMQPASV
jgi:carboxypeptidase Taq